MHNQCFDGFCSFFFVLNFVEMMLRVHFCWKHYFFTKQISLLHLKLVGECQRYFFSMWTRVFVRSFTMYRAILGRGFRIRSLFLLGSVERSSPGDCSHFVCALAKLWKQSNLVCRSRPGLVYLFDNNMGTLYWRIKAQGMVYVYKKYIVWTHRKR